MFVFRNVNYFTLGLFGPLFYLLPLVIYGILKIRTKNKPLPEGYATFERRALAFLIDFALIEGLAVGMNLVFKRMTDPPAFWGGVLILIFAIFNMAILPAKTGWTLGKRALSIKIVKTGDRKLGVYDMLYREIIKSWFSLSIIYMGCFWMLIGKNQLTWHDSVVDRVYDLKWKQADKSLEEDAP